MHAINTQSSLFFFDGRVNFLGLQSFINEHFFLKKKKLVVF